MICMPHGCLRYLTKSSQDLTYEVSFRRGKRHVLIFETRILSSKDSACKPYVRKRLRSVCSGADTPVHLQKVRFITRCACASQAALIWVEKTQTDMPSLRHKQKALPPRCEESFLPPPRPARRPPCLPPAPAARPRPRSRGLCASAPGEPCECGEM